MTAKTECPVNVSSYYNYYCLLMGYINGDKPGRMCVWKRVERFPKKPRFSPQEEQVWLFPALGKSGIVEFTELPNIIYLGQVRRQIAFSLLLVYAPAHREEFSSFSHHLGITERFGHGIF